MKTILLFLLACAVAFAADEIKLPAELRLSDGRVLKNPSVSKLNVETVLLRHAGGVIAVRYEFLPANIRPELEKRRPGGSRLPSGDVAPEKQDVSGQVFIQTRGAGPYKFGDVTVYAFEESVSQLWASTPRGTVKLPQPIAETVTDADGKFRLSVPKGRAFIVFAQARRLVATDKTEYYEWRVPSGEVKHFDQLNLSTEWRHEPQPVEIERIP